MGAKAGGNRERVAGAEAIPRVAGLAGALPTRMGQGQQGRSPNGAAIPWLMLDKGLLKIVSCMLPRGPISSVRSGESFLGLQSYTTGFGEV